MMTSDQPIEPARPFYVYRAINEVSRALGALGISKDSKNATQGFNFRGIDDVLNALSTPLVNAGLVILPRIIDRQQSERPTAKGGIQYDVVVHVAFDLVSVLDGSCHTVSMVGEACDSGDKATSKAVSMAYKYMAFDTFCIPVEGLEDADASTPAPTAKPTAAKPPADPEKTSAPADVAVSGGDAPGVDMLLARITGAATLTELGNLKTEAWALRKDARWEEVKAAYTAANTKLKGIN